MSLLLCAAAASSRSVAGPTVRAAATYNGNNVRNLSVTVPSSAVAGDLLVVAFSTIGGSPQTQSGWTQRVGVTSSTGTFNQLFVYTKTCASGDIGATLTWVVSPSADTMVSGVTVAIRDTPVAAPTSSSSFNQNTNATTWTVTGPSSFAGKKPSRLEFFAQTPDPLTFPSTIPTFSSYTGAGSLIASATSDYNRISCYFKDNTTSTASAAMTSNLTGACTGAAFAIRGI